MDFFSLTEFHLSASQQISSLILHSLWQGLVVALFVFTANALMWRASAKARYWVAVAGLLVMIAGVFSTWWWMQSTDSVIDTTRVVWTTPLQDMAVPQLTLDSIDPIELEAEPPSVMRWAPFVTLVYLIGVGVMLLRLTLSVIGVNRLSCGSVTVESHVTDRVYSLAKKISVRSRPAIKACERTVIPFAAGVFRPVILLPTFAMSGMTQPELDAIFLHELAHIGRGDLIVNVVQRFAESFLFFNPGTWYISRVITTERENCCDDIVLGQCEQSTYASALIRLAELLTGKPEEVAPVVALAATGAKPSQLKRRVQRILGVPSAPRGPSVGVVLSCVLVVAIVAVQLHAQTDGQEDPATGAYLDATDKNKDLELRAPLIVSFNKKGEVASFTAFNLDSSMSDSAQRDRFNSILKYLQSDKRVVIDTTRVRRKQNGTLAMTVSGKNLMTDAIQDAIRKADSPPEKNDPSKEQKMGDRRAKITALVEWERPNLSGPVKIEFVDDSDVFVVRGKKEDVDHIMKLVEQSRFSKTDQELIKSELGESVDNKSTSDRVTISRVVLSMDKEYRTYDLRFRTVLQAISDGSKSVLVATDTKSKEVLVAAPTNVHQQIKALLESPDFDLTQFAKGRTLYQKHCVTCHGKNGEGNGPTAQFLSPTPRHFASNDYKKVKVGTANARRDLEALLISGIGGTAMPSFKQLAKAERSSLAMYVEFLSARGRLDLKVHHHNMVGSAEGSLAFPIETERAMMGDAAGKPIRQTRAFEIFDPNMVVPESIEKGMQIDAIENGGKY